MYLKDNNRETADNMSWENLTKVVEFFVYMLVLKGKIRRGFQELSYTPNNELYHFAAKLKARKDATRGESALIAPLVEASDVTPGITALNLASTCSADTAAN